MTRSSSPTLVTRRGVVDSTWHELSRPELAGLAADLEPRSAPVHEVELVLLVVEVRPADDARCAARARSRRRRSRRAPGGPCGRRRLPSRRSNRRSSPWVPSVRLCCAKSTGAPASFSSSSRCSLPAAATTVRASLRRIHVRRRSRSTSRSKPTSFGTSDVRVEDVSFTGPGETRLKAYLLMPSGSTGRHPAVIYAHGAGGDRQELLDEARTWPTRAP